MAYTVNIADHKFIPASYWMENETTTKNLIPSSKIYVYEIDNRINGFIGTLDNYIAGLFVVEDHQSKV